MALQLLTLDSSGEPDEVLDTIRLVDGGLVYATGQARGFFRSRIERLGCTPAELMTLYADWSNGYLAIRPAPEA